MPLTKTADRYRGRARSKQKTIDRMRTPPTPPAAGEWPADPADALASWCADNLIVPPGHPLAGQPMVMPWYIRDFLQDALALGITESLISTARKNSKTAGIAMLVNGILAGPLRKPGTRIGAVSLTREKSGELLGQCRAIAEASDLQGVEFMKTPAPGMIRTPDGSTAEFLSADKNSGAASGFDLVLVDELGLFSERDRELVAGMRSSMSARGGRLIALSIRGSSPLLEEMLDRADLPTCVVHLYAPDVPEGSDVDIHDREIWAAGNPGLDPAIGIKQMSYMIAEVMRVEKTPSDLASFMAYDLNLPQTPSREMIFAPADLRQCYVDVLPERRGPAYLGFDFGGATSGTAAFCVWPATGACQGWLAFGDNPDLITRGRRDGARYDLMHQRGELRTYPGRVTPVDQFMADVAHDLAGVKVVAGACDSYKDAEAQDFLERAGLHWPVKFRRVGAGKDGGADVRALQRLVLNGKLQMLESLALTTAVSMSTIRRDGNGNPGLDKSTGKGRIDLLSAAVIACGLAESSFDRPARRRWRSAGVA